MTHKMLYADVLAAYNQCALSIDPLDEVLLVSVQTDKFGLPIGVESARRACEIIDHLLRVIKEYDFSRFVIHFDYAYSLAHGTVRSIDGRAIDLMFYKDGDDDVSDSV